MTVALIVFALLITFLILPLSAEISCNNGKISISVKLFIIPIFVYPKRNRIEEKKKENKLELSDRLNIANTLRKTIGKALRKFEISKLKLHFVSAGDDPYYIVTRYNNVNAIAGFLYPFVEPENRDIEIFTDFEAEKSALSAFLALKVKIYRLIVYAPGAALGIIKIINKRRKLKNGKQTKSGNADNHD